MTEEITFLEILHRICVRQGWALLLTSTHHPAGFATKAHTTLRALTVAAIPDGWKGPRKRGIKLGEQVASCPLYGVDGDLEAAAEMVVELLTRRKAEAA